MLFFLGRGGGACWFVYTFLYTFLGEQEDYDGCDDGVFCGFPWRSLFLLIFDLHASREMLE